MILLVTLRHIAPPIWRRLLIPDRLTLHQLHRVFQIVFGWQDYHLYDFQVGERCFEAPDPEAEGESSVTTTLRSLQLDAGAQFVYRYDFGDGWKHDIAVEQVLPLPTKTEESWPSLLDGARAAPLEDSGGPDGYAELVAAIRDTRHPQHTAMREWVGPGYDPELFDRWMVGRVLTLVVAWGGLEERE